MYRDANTETMADKVELINLLIAGWNEYGYQEPPTPDCKGIPPLGERNAAAITAGHDAIEQIDQLTAQLYRIRQQLITEMRQDSDIRAKRVDAMLAERAADPASCGHPRNDDSGS